MRPSGEQSATRQAQPLILITAISRQPAAIADNPVIVTPVQWLMSRVLSLLHPAK